MSNHHTFYVADISALVAIFGSYSGLLPGAAAFLAVIWYAIAIWDRFHK